MGLLKQAHVVGRRAHAYLITGPEGSGKRRLASEFALLVNGAEGYPAEAHPDIRWVEPESKSRRILIEQTRDLESALRLGSVTGGTKVGIIVDADRLVPAAANSFLKTLEEPPSNTMLLLIAETADALLETVVSRCIEVPLRPEKEAVLATRERALLEVVAKTMEKGTVDLAGAFGLARRFSELAAEAKEAIQSEMEKRMKGEEVKYRQASESGDWLDSREDYYKALVEARYLGERGRLVDALCAWWADVARQTGGGGVLQLPDFAVQTGVLAERMGADEALRRFDALVTMSEQLGQPGVQEQLALEVGFLEAFG